MGKRNLATRLLKRAERARVALELEAAEQLAAYVGMLQRWNSRINLTALANNEAGLDRLIIEPLIVARYLPKTVSCIAAKNSAAGVEFENGGKQDS